MNSISTFYLNAKYFFLYYVPFIMLADAPQVIADLVGAHAMAGELLSNVSHIALFIFAYYKSRQPNYVVAIGITYTIANIATVFQSPISNFIFQISFSACISLLFAKFYVSRHQTASEEFERMGKA